MTKTLDVPGPQGYHPRHECSNFRPPRFKNSGAIHTYGYDANGLRVKQTAEGQTTEFLFDASNPTGYAKAVEEHVDGQLSKTYTLGLDVISQTDADGTVTLLADGHGSTRQLADALGHLVAVAGSTLFAVYDAYGVGRNFEVANARTNLLYTGQFTDRYTGYQYLLERWMDMMTGRFLSMDPFAGDAESPMSLHRYLYTPANPVMFKDPTGMFSIMELLSVMSIQNEQRYQKANNAYKTSVRGIKLGVMIALAEMAGVAMSKAVSTDESGNTWARFWPLMEVYYAYLSL